MTIFKVKSIVVRNMQWLFCRYKTEFGESISPCHLVTIPLKEGKNDVKIRR